MTADVTGSSTAPVTSGEVATGAPAGGRRSLGYRPGKLDEVVIVAVPALVLLVLGWRRRWIADDGLIFVRVARQLLAGHGAVYNVGDRAESATSTVWVYLITAVSFITRIDPVKVAIYLGLLLASSGLALAVDGSRRLWRAHHSGLLLPVGAFVMLGLPPYWNFATAGLDTGLTFCWIGGVWWLLVALRDPTRNPSSRLPAVAAFVFGLGPLVRPELGIITVGAAAVLVITLRPLTWRRMLRLGAFMFALPVAYEVWRAAYYGILVPLPAEAKVATGSDWYRGLMYFFDFVSPYKLVIPCLLVLLLFVLALQRPTGKPARFDRVLAATPVLCGLVLTVYVIRLGGDFMHARMMLAPLLLILMPVMVLPIRALGGLAIVALAVWAGWSAGVPHPDLPDGLKPFGPHGVVDERAFWAGTTRQANPTSAAAFVRAAKLEPVMDEARRRAAATGQGVLVVHQMFDNQLLTFSLPLRRGLPWKVVLVENVLGTGGATARLDEAVFDTIGLGYPLGAHATLGERGRPGHEKELGLAYVLADLADPSATLPGVSSSDVAAARKELQCSSLQELIAAGRDPLSFGRLGSNLLGSLSRTSLKVPLHPQAACPS
jgi:arabinofuranosyltransferase